MEKLLLFLMNELVVLLLLLLLLLLILLLVLLLFSITRGALSHFNRGCFPLCRSTVMLAEVGCGG